MTNASTNSASDHRFRYGNPSLECDHAQMHTVCSQLATVVSFSGEVDDTNVGAGQRVRHGDTSCARSPSCSISAT